MPVTEFIPGLTVMAEDLVEPVAPGWQLITATLVAIALLVTLITAGIPALAGLSAMHGFVPPHPGPVTAIRWRRTGVPRSP